MDVPYAYNAILGRGTLNRFGAVPHHNYLFLRIPGPQGLITTHDDQELARRIEYGHRPLLPSRHIHTMTQEDSKDPPSAHPGHRYPPRPQPKGDIKLVPIHQDQPDRTIQIGADLASGQEAQLLAVLQSNLDIFAWSSQDLPGVDRSIIEHLLQVDSKARPKGSEQNRSRTLATTTPLLHGYQLCQDMVDLTKKAFLQANQEHTQEEFDAI